MIVIARKQIEGQLNIFEYLEAQEKVYPVDIMGLCDDAYCPGCKACLDEIKYLDCQKCPHCGLRIDWGPWHHFNDEEE